VYAHARYELLGDLVVARPGIAPGLPLHDDADPQVVLINQRRIYGHLRHLIAERKPLVGANPHKENNSLDNSKGKSAPPKQVKHGKRKTTPRRKR